jgi:hypothetical protein
VDVFGRQSGKCRDVAGALFDGEIAEVLARVGMADWLHDDDIDVSVSFGAASKISAAKSYLSAQHTQLVASVSGTVTDNFKVAVPDV